MKYLPDNSIGLYIHIPFCKKKCLYCDFYSAVLSDSVYSAYLDALLREIKNWGGKLDRPVSSVYIGGGTPSVLGRDIKRLVDEIKSSFCVLSDAEITAECNPNTEYEFLYYAKLCGVNRISVGVQAGSNVRLRALGRSHTVSDAEKTVSLCRDIGLDNVSCDIMISLPDSSNKTLSEDIDFICSLSPEHISAYILKIEERTAFYKYRDELNLPDDDSTANQYLTLCSELKKRGYEHYEISNFARENKKSRHNLKYWRCEEYLGIGPSAHSFLNGKRFYYPRDIKAFIKGNTFEYDGEGGTNSERIMLSLRTNDGVEINNFNRSVISKIEEFKKAGFLDVKDNKVCLTDKGMLLSNSIITELIYEDL